MFFRLTYKVGKLLLPKDQPITFNLKGKEGITIHLRRPIEEEIEVGHQTSTAFCEITGNFKVNKKAEKVFQKIEKNQVLKKNERWYQKYKLEDGTEIELPHFTQFPQHFQSYINTIESKLANPAKSIISTLRWRYDLPGSHRPISTRGMKWSRDQKFWHPAPLNLHIRMTPGDGSFKFPKNAHDSLLDLADEIQQEPVHHELFREAWSLLSANYRSSLVIGVASAEVGLKNLISILLPESEWMLENVPSPPIVKIIEEYLPTLPAKNKINGKVLPPPKEMIESIRKGVFARNQVVHKGGAPPSLDSLEEILLSIKDLLWLIDYYSGFKWALNHLRDGTKTKLGI